MGFGEGGPAPAPILWLTDLMDLQGQLQTTMCTIAALSSTMDTYSCGGTSCSEPTRPLQTLPPSTATPSSERSVPRALF